MLVIEAEKLIMEKVADGVYIVDREAILNAPTFEAVPVEYAHWEWYEHAYDWNLGGYVCSNCRAKNDNLPGLRDFGVNDPYLYVGSKFCPNCGRRMVKENKDGRFNQKR